MDKNTQIYGIDSSTIIDLYKKDGFYSRDVHSSLWTTIEDYITKGRIVSSIDVYEELKIDKQQEFIEWLKNRKKMFLDIDEPQVEKIKKILETYPLLAEGHEHRADPTLVALCATKSYVVLTNEKLSTTASKNTPQIPNLCEELEVGCVNINDFCRREGIRI